MVTTYDAMNMSKKNLKLNLKCTKETFF